MHIYGWRFQYYTLANFDLISTYQIADTKPCTPMRLLGCAHYDPHGDIVPGVPLMTVVWNVLEFMLFVAAAAFLVWCAL